MLVKVAVLPAGTPFETLYSNVDALAIHSWHSLLRRTVDWDRPLEIGYGALEATTRWLEASDALEWTVRLMQV